MKLHQLSLFLENRPGQLKTPCRALAQAGIDILTSTLAYTQQFGIFRLIVQDWQRAKQVLEAAGAVVNVTEVLAVEVSDKPGGLAGALEVFDQAGLGLEYMYAFASGQRGQRATVILRFEDPDRAVAALRNHPDVRVMGSEEIFSR